MRAGIVAIIIFAGLLALGHYVAGPASCRGEFAIPGLDAQALCEGQMHLNREGSVLLYFASIAVAVFFGLLASIGRRRPRPDAEAAKPADAATPLVVPAETAAGKKDAAAVVTPAPVAAAPVVSPFETKSGKESEKKSEKEPEKKSEKGPEKKSEKEPEKKPDNKDAPAAVTAHADPTRPVAHPSALTHGQLAAPVVASDGTEPLAAASLGLAPPASATVGEADGSPTTSTAPDADADKKSEVKAEVAQASSNEALSQDDTDNTDNTDNTDKTGETVKAEKADGAQKPVAAEAPEAAPPAAPIETEPGPAKSAAEAAENAIQAARFWTPAAAEPAAQTPETPAPDPETQATADAIAARLATQKESADPAFEGTNEELLERFRELKLFDTENSVASAQRLLDESTQAAVAKGIDPKQHLSQIAHLVLAEDPDLKSAVVRGVVVHIAARLKELGVANQPDQNSAAPAA